MHFVLCSPQVWWLGALCNPLAGLEIVCSPKDAHTVSRNPIILPFPLNNKLRSQKKFQPWTNNNVAKSSPNKLALCRRRTTIVRKRGALAVKTGSRSETSGGLIWSPSTVFLKITLVTWSVCSVWAPFLLFTFCFRFFLLFLNCSTVVASWALFFCVLSSPGV